jgi:hypothetical protein
MQYGANRSFAVVPDCTQAPFEHVYASCMFGGKPHGKRTLPPQQPSPWIQWEAQGPTPPSTYADGVQFGWPLRAAQWFDRFAGEEHPVGEDVPPSITLLAREFPQPSADAGASAAMTIRRMARESARVISAPQSRRSYPVREPRN